jgi:integrase
MAAKHTQNNVAEKTGRLTAPENSGFEGSSTVRIPPSPLKSGVFDSENVTFLKPNNRLWHPMAEKYPYRKARFVDHGGDVSKRWYVLFYAYDVSEEKLRRVRLFEPFNRLKNIQKRYEEAAQMIDQINIELRQGKVLGKNTIVSASDLSRKTVIDAIQYFIDEKTASGNRPTYIKKFRTLQGKFLTWATLNKIPQVKTRELTQPMVVEFFRYLRERSQSNKTYNNDRSDFSIFLNFINKRRPGTFKINFINSVDKLPVVVKQHAAYTDVQVKAVMEYTKTKFPQLRLFIQFIYYTLARPKQLLSVRIRDIDLENNRLFLPGEVDKNKRDGWVSISPGFKTIIISYGLDKLPGDYFVFGLNSKPGTNHIKSVFSFSRRHRTVLKDLKLDGLGLKFTLYSYKHSGAISLYKATKDIKLVQRQCRHTTIEQTNAYLRDLDVLSDHDALKAWHGAA